MGIKLLVVDDDNFCCELFKAYLAYKDDWQITTEHSPVDALTLLADGEFDVVVSDLKMPVMNGLVFLSQVSTKSPESVRILISGEKMDKEKPSYVDFQYEKSKFSMVDLVEKVDQKMTKF